MGKITSTHDNKISLLIEHKSYPDKFAPVEIGGLPLTLKAKVMSTLDILIDKGRREGVEIGVEKTQLKIISNLIKSSALSDEQIASVADVKLDFVRKVRAELNS